MELRELANILLQWGPAGAAAILIIVAEKKLRTRWDISKGQDRRICAWLYSGNWVFIALLLTVVSVIWVIDRNKTSITMSGIVQDLRLSYRVNDPTKELYTKTKLKSNWLQDVHWHYSNQNLPNQVEIRLEHKNDFHDYSIPLDIVDDVLNIHIVFKEGKLWLKNNAKTIELESVHSASSELKPLAKADYPVKFSFMSVAYADESVDIDLVLDAIESDDSYVRQYASQYLVNNVNSSLPVIEEKIVSDETSETMQIGLISALARASSPELSAERKWRISEDTEKMIFIFSFSENPVLAAQSRRYLIRNMSEKYLQWLDLRCDFSAEEKSAEMEYCSYVALNLIYNLSIKKWLDSVDGQVDESIYEITSALEILEKGINIWRYASNEKAIQFGKIYYGKALLSHELSKLQKGDISKKSKDNSVGYFKELLAYLNKGYAGEYEYPHHKQQANCYIQNQIQDCIDKYAP